MAYADVAALKIRLGSMYSAVYSADSIAAEDLADAQAEIDGSLTARYEVPVSGPADTLLLLKGWTLSLAEELAYRRTSNAVIPEKIRTRAEDIRQRLAELREGKFLLPHAQECSSGTIVSLSMDRPVFGRSRMRRY